MGLGKTFLAAAFLDEIAYIPPQGALMSDIEIYESPDGDIRLNVQLEDETVWLTQAQMSQLFARDVSTISKHIRNVFEEGELDEESNLQKMQISG